MDGVFFGNPTVGQRARFAEAGTALIPAVGATSRPGARPVIGREAAAAVPSRG